MSGEFIAQLHTFLSSNNRTNVITYALIIVVSVVLFLVYVPILMLTLGKHIIRVRQLILMVPNKILIEDYEDIRFVVGRLS